jgi:hypothetical protein
MAKASKTRASKQNYTSPSQMVLVGFESPFHQKLNPDNRWILMAHKIPWDSLVGVYQHQMKNNKTGADGINPRVAIGSMLIKHICDFSDRETVLQIQENVYMQYFLGYSSFSNEEPFDPSLFVDFRKRLGVEQINSINEKILGLSKEQNKASSVHKAKDQNSQASTPLPAHDPSPPKTEDVLKSGQLIMDATACPQDIAYPTDLNLLNDAREKSERLIDILFDEAKHTVKPRTYRQKARKDYLKTAQKKTKTKKEIHKAIRRQLAYLKRNIRHINTLLDQYETIPLNRHNYKDLLVIQTLYDQQLEMFVKNTHSIEHRIVSIKQPHVRPIVRGKTNANVEFGAKINASLMNGYFFLDDLSWDAFNEGTRLIATVEKYKKRFGYYPAVVLADKIYCTRDNRAYLKSLGIILKAKPLGRPKAVKEEHVSPGERNPIEGKFGQAKTAYGLNRIKARLQQTSESWIASIIMVLNLVKLAGVESLWIILKLLTLTARLFENKQYSIAQNHTLDLKNKKAIFALT